ncbi:MAG TPA: M50 family metallopeptidase [Fimbriimonadaceae bacterium]|nr:M50 family metallopeptidase [Fimbriimonadaceae bacterium]
MPVLCGLCAAAAATAVYHSLAIGLLSFLVGIVAVWILAAAIFVLFVLPIAIHELGHVLAGLAVGFPFAALELPYVGIYREREGKLRIRRSGIAVPVGFAYAEVDEAPDLVRRYAVFIAGGPVFSLLFVIPWLVLLAARMPFDFDRDGWILLFAWLAASMLPGTLIPRTVKGLRTDAGVLWDLWRHPEKRSAIIARLMLWRAFNSGVEVRDLSERLVQESIAARGQTVDDARALLLAHFHYLELNDNKRAHEALARALAFTDELSQAAATVKSLARTTAATYQARYCLELAQAQQWMQGVQPTPGSELGYQYARLCIAWLENDRQTAAAAAHTLEALRKRSRKRMERDDYFDEEVRSLTSSLESAPWREAILSQARITYAWGCGVRPRDWNEADLPTALGAKPKTLGEGRGLLLNYYHRLDWNDLAGAQEMIERIALLPPGRPGHQVTEQGAALESSYMQAAYRLEPDAASERLKGVPASPALETTRMRVEAAIAWARRDFVESSRLAHIAQEQLRMKRPDCPDSVKAEIEWLDQFAQEAVSPRL